MKSLELVSLFFAGEPRELAEVLSHARDSGLYTKESMTPGDALNILMIQLMAQNRAGRLTPETLQNACQKVDAADLKAGSRIVYALLLVDLARDVGGNVTFVGEVSVSGSEIDWELLGAFAPASAAFTRQVKQLEAAHAAATKRGVAS